MSAPNTGRRRACITAGALLVSNRIDGVTLQTGYMGNSFLRLFGFRAARQGGRFAAVPPGADSFGPGAPGRGKSRAPIAGAPCPTHNPEERLPSPRAGRSRCGTARPGLSAPPSAWYRSPEDPPLPRRRSAGRQGPWRKTWVDGKLHEELGRESPNRLTAMHRDVSLIEYLFP